MQCGKVQNVTDICRRPACHKLTLLPQSRLFGYLAGSSVALPRAVSHLLCLPLSLAAEGLLLNQSLGNCGPWSQSSPYSNIKMKFYENDPWSLVCAPSICRCLLLYTTEFNSPDFVAHHAADSSHHLMLCTAFPDPQVNRSHWSMPVLTCYFSRDCLNFNREVISSSKEISD